MKMILMLEDVSIWRLLFIMGFFAFLIFVLVRTVPSAEPPYEGTLPMPFYQDSLCLR
jgi:hypothetical protein